MSRKYQYCVREFFSIFVSRCNKTIAVNAPFIFLLHIRINKQTNTPECKLVSFGFASYAAFIFCKILKFLFKRFYVNVDFLGEILLHSCYRLICCSLYGY